MNKILIQTAFALAFGTVTLTTQAATLVNGNVLTITSGVPTYDSNGNLAGVSSGSWFGCDCNGNNALTSNELTPLSQGTTGIVVGVATLPGASHAGAPLLGDTNAIDAPYSFFGNTASDATSIGITGSTAAGLDMSGWKWAWSGVPVVNMGSGAWGAGFSNGIGNFVWDGVYGHAYTLDYHARFPEGDPSGIGYVAVGWHFEGVVAVPEASTYAMMLAGLGLVGLATQRRKRA
jgi:hypothetical protein